MLPAIGCTALSSHRALPTSIDELISAYGPSDIRPGLASPPSTFQDVVEVNFGIDSVLELDQTRQQWGLNGFLRAWWRDQRLAYNESVLGPEVTLRGSSELMSRIWRAWP
jgi:hypothetical protein